MTKEEQGTQSKDISSVVALVRDEAGRVLLAASSESGPWSCIGGEFTDGENPASAAVRFALEDCGLEIEVGEVLATLSGDAYRVLWECGADATYQVTVFRASALGAPSNAPMQTKWIDADEIATAHLDQFATVAFSGLGLR